MFKLLFVILIIRLDLLIAPNTSGTTSSGHQTKSILPLVLIRTPNGEFIRPTDISKPITDERGNLLFGTEFSAAKEGKQFFFCGQAPTEENTKMSIDGENSDDQYSSYELSEPQLESESGSGTAVGTNYLQCTHEPKPFALKLTVNDGPKGQREVDCGLAFNKKSRMFAYVYKVKTNDDDKTHIFEVYRFCYDEMNENVLYTEHTLASPKLLNYQNESFERERNQIYEMSDNGFHDFGTRFEDIKNEYYIFENQKKKKKWTDEMIEDSKITLTYLLSDEKLIPSNDMAFASWRKTTFHVLNAKLMETVKIELWNHISELIRKDAIDKSREYLIHTGVFDLTPEGKDYTQLMQSPDVWIKMVQYKNENEKIHEVLAIVMIHNPKIALVAETFNDICKQNVCGNAFAENPKFSVIGTSICCTTSTGLIDFHFDFELDNNVKPLKINSLYTKQDDAAPEVVQVPEEIQVPEEKRVPEDIQVSEEPQDGLHISDLLSPD